MSIHVIVQYCTHPLAARVAEYDECFRRNLENPHVATVHNLVEPGTIVPRALKSHAKYVERPLHRWITYRDAFDYANANLVGEVVCLSNLDIFLDPSSPWDQTRSILASGVVLCQSRIEFDPPDRFFKDPLLAERAFAISQDAWLFIPPIDVPDCEFELGILACDNAIAERVSRAGLLPVNLMDRFRVFHLDRTRDKTSADQNDLHNAEVNRRPQRHPERQGYRSVPNFDQVQSVDGLMDSLNLNASDRYRVTCWTLNEFLRILPR